MVIMGFEKLGSVRKCWAALSVVASHFGFRRIPSSSSCSKFCQLLNPQKYLAISCCTCNVRLDVHISHDLQPARYGLTVCALRMVENYQRNRQQIVNWREVNSTPLSVSRIYYSDPLGLEVLDDFLFVVFSRPYDSFYFILFQLTNYLNILKIIQYSNRAISRHAKHIIVRVAHSKTNKYNNNFWQ